MDANPCNHSLFQQILLLVLLLLLVSQIQLSYCHMYSNNDCVFWSLVGILSCVQIELMLLWMPGKLWIKRKNYLLLARTEEVLTSSSRMTERSYCSFAHLSYFQWRKFLWFFLCSLGHKIHIRDPLWYCLGQDQHGSWIFNSIQFREEECYKVKRKWGYMGSLSFSKKYAIT